MNKEDFEFIKNNMYTLNQVCAIHVLSKIPDLVEAYEQILKEKDSIQEQANKLAVYEDTDLTPERVAELAKAERDGRLVVVMSQHEFDERLEKLRAENWKVDGLYRDCGGVPPHLEEKLFELLGVKKYVGYIDTRAEAESTRERIKRGV